MKSNITGKASIAIQATPADVWKALTTPSLIKQYFFGTNAVSDWKEGSPLIFKGEWQGKSYEDKGTILKVIPEKLFQYDYWSALSGIPDKPENYVRVSYELSERDGFTNLKVTQENIPDEKTKEHSEQNWNKVLGGLKDMLEGQAADF